MGKKSGDEYLDGPAMVLRGDTNSLAANLMVICENEPTDFADANTVKGSGGERLGSVAVSSGDFTKGDAAGGGRKVDVAQKTGASITDSGNAQHIALLDTVNSVLLQVTTCTLQAVTSGNTATVNTYALSHGDPT